MQDFAMDELALEVIDMLAVALHFAGAKKEKIESLIDLYLKELDAMDENLPYEQKEIIEIICTLQRKYPKLFWERR